LSKIKQWHEIKNDFKSLQHRVVLLNFTVFPFHLSFLNKKLRTPNTSTKVMINYEFLMVNFYQIVIKKIFTEYTKFLECLLNDDRALLSTKTGFPDNRNLTYGNIFKILFTKKLLLILERITLKS
jgi:hypothetical protein